MATKKRTNPLIDQAKRKEEMDQLVKKAQGIPSTKKQHLTLSMTEDDIAIIKKMAIDQKTTVSGLLHQWILENKD
jgi:hypothetical protein